MASNVKLESFSDRELLWLLEDLKDDEGWVTLSDLATRVGLHPNGKSDEQLAIYARRCVAVRLAWIKRLTGCVEKSIDRPLPSWRLTVTGEEVLKAKVPDSMLKGLGQMGDFGALTVLDQLARRYRGTDINTANLMRREWSHGTHRKRPN